MTADKDFFISYTGADQAWAEWIAETLEQAGHSTVLQAWDFRPGENFVQRMNEALAETERVLAVLSPAYFHSEYARDEWTAALIRDRGQPDRLLPVVIAACELPPLLANRIYIDLIDLQEQQAAERLLVGVHRGRARPAGRQRFPGAGQPGAAGVRFPGRQPAIFNVPARNPHFTGRGELLQAVRLRLSEATTGTMVHAQAIYGLGGVGKTQLAVEYAHRFAADYDLVWWIPAEDSLVIPGRLAALARRLGLPELPAVEEQVAALFDELGQRERWLLVYDNVDEPRALTGYRPPTGGHVLITSRNPAWGAIAKTVRVGVLEREEAIAFLQTRTRDTDTPAAAALAPALGDLPLALAQAGAYIEETQISLGDYLELLRERAAELFSLGQPVDYEYTVATTWALSIERVRAQQSAAEDLLRLYSYLAPDEIPRYLAYHHAAELPEGLRSVGGDRIAFDRALGRLGRFSLVTLTRETVSVHRLVQAVTRHDLSADDQKRWAGAAARLVLSTFPLDSHDVRSWPRCALLLPHAIVATAHASIVETEPGATANLLNRAADYFRGTGQYREARYLLERALETRHTHLGSDQLELARLFSNLGTVLRALGDLSAARVALERALAIREARLDPDDPDLANTINSLGLVLFNLGDLPAAYSAYIRALKSFSTRFGPEHLDVALVLNNLGGVLLQAGQLVEAHRVFEQALMIREAELGALHPLTVQTLNNLGTVYYHGRNLPAARAAFERSGRILEEQFGPDHPEVATNLNNLGLVLTELRELSTARAIHERALSIRIARLGPDHLDVAQSLNNLGLTLYGLGDLPAARIAFERCLVIQNSQLGPHHPDITQAQRSLQQVLRDQNELSN